MNSIVPSAVVRSMLSPLGVVDVQTVAPGMSGARVFRCRLSSGQAMALKRWPDGTPRSRVEEVHRVIRRSNEQQCNFVPKLVNLRTESPTQSGLAEHTIFTDAAVHWELMQWMPGESASADAPLEQIRSGAEAIAQFHHSTRSLGISQQPPPAAIARLERIAELDPIVSQLSNNGSITETAGELEPELAEAIHHSAQMVRWNWNEVHSRVTRSLLVYVDKKVPTQYVLRDVHRQHVLFAAGKGKASALIDFDALRVDTPIADLARWAGSFLADRDDPEAVWAAALAGFRHQNTLKQWKDGFETELEGNMAKDLCFATSWIGLANWLVWVICEQRRFPAGPQAIADRLRELTQLASQQL